MRRLIVQTLLLVGLFLHPSAIYAQVDYSVISVDEETGLELTQITSENDYVSMPEVKRTGSHVNWYTNKIIDISPDGTKLAYLSSRNNSTNIFIKDINKKGGAVQRTKRQAVLDFSYSPDGKYICFSENDGKDCNQLFQTSSTAGYICRQITSGNKDFSPIYSSAMNLIYFAREEKRDYSIWSYNVTNNYLSNYTNGTNPYPIKNGNAIICVRKSKRGMGEIWCINYETGVEECILSDANRNFSNPTLSPDGNWILLVGSSTLMNGKKTYPNTDIFVCKKDGSDLRQLTYHAADDLSPTWSRDGQYVYFVSQRGSSNAVANIWRIKINL